MLFAELFTGLPGHEDERSVCAVRKCVIQRERHERTAGRKVFFKMHFELDVENSLRNEN